MKRVWLVVDARQNIDTEAPLPQPLLDDARSGGPGQFWLERLAGQPVERQNLLLREADILIDREASTALSRYPKLPAWIEATPPTRGDVKTDADDTGDDESAATKLFATRHFDGDPSSLSDPQFDKTNELLGDPEHATTSFDTIGETARAKAKVKRYFEYLKEIVLIFSLLPVGVVAFSKLFGNESDGIEIAQQLLILIGFALTLTLWQTSLKKRWYEARAVREIWRSLQHSFAAIDPVRPIQVRFFPQHRGIIRTLIHLARQENGPPAIRDAKNYREKRVDKQFKYFEKNIREAGQMHRLLRFAFLITAIVSAVCAVVTLLVHLGAFPDIHRSWMIRSFKDFGAALFPSLSGICLGLIGLMGTSRRSGYYSVMREHLSVLEGRLEYLETEPNIGTSQGCQPTLNELILETESVLLEEVAGWVRRNQF